MHWRTFTEERVLQLEGKLTKSLEGN